MATPSPTLFLSQNPSGQEEGSSHTREKTTDVNHKDNKLEKWEEISGLCFPSLSFLRSFEASFTDWLLLPVALILLLLFLLITLDCHIFQYEGTWSRAREQGHCL